MKKLGIIGAMAVEVDTLKEKMDDLTLSTHAGMEFASGTLEKLPVVIALCGVGKVNAALCVQILCDCFGVTHVVNTGVAGSLWAELDIGDIVVSQDAMYHDFDVRKLGYPMGQVPGLDVLSFPADDLLLALAFQASETVNPGHTRIGRVASGDQFISSAQQKDAIIQSTHALCAEMEGAAIAQAAYLNKVPFVILRAISDKADDSAEMDYPAFEALAAKRCAAVTQALAAQLWVDEQTDSIH